MGKSMCAAFLASRGIPVADTDLIAREVVAPGQPAVGEIREAFGPDVFDGEGRLDRVRLAKVVFADATARRRLEALLHPRIRAEWQRRATEWQGAGCGLGAIVIPLLFETDAASLFGAVVCVACSAATQRQRLLQRGWTPAHVEQRLAAQLSIDDKMRRADFVVWTEPPPAVHEEQVRRILRTLLAPPRQLGGHGEAVHAAQPRCDY